MASPTTTSSPRLALSSPAAHASDDAPGHEPRIDSRAWFAHHRVIQIDHRGTIYRLRCTAQGKLILTK